MKFVSKSYLVIPVSIMWLFSSCASSKSPDTEEQKQIQFKVLEITSSAAQKYKVSAQTDSENDRTSPTTN